MMKKKKLTIEITENDISIKEKNLTLIDKAGIISVLKMNLEIEHTSKFMNKHNEEAEKLNERLKQ